MDNSSVYDWVVDIDLLTNITKDGWKVNFIDKYGFLKKFQNKIAKTLLLLNSEFEQCEKFRKLVKFSIKLY